ncbi:DUF2997 domain-containing protein [Anaeromyxobacter paludicola]|uniref:DUF2997 domain-containing protein n=1 Tax=Anaeromyxobacter paludicola TaxID=2918171 RepID=A0ABM7XCC6_9BACT|nr:DUF2997 domain-containing protein [Anaeromyxobacter paludicola]BDG09442.1 hypothetical protein AMPC_25550 [Anaeromyxobacter paludicola]
MATKVEIEVEIDPQGNVKLTTRGLKGQSCLKQTEQLEKALGKVAAREKTREFYEQPVSGATTGVKRGW